MDGCFCYVDYVYHDDSAAFERNASSFDIDKTEFAANSAWISVEKQDNGELSLLWQLEEVFTCRDVIHACS